MVKLLALIRTAAAAIAGSLAVSHLRCGFGNSLQGPRSPTEGSIGIVIAAVAAILSSSAPAADFTYSDHRALSELVVRSLNLSADIVSVRKGLPRDRYRNTGYTDCA